jgi:tetratricopeptide (TPR) repeat protein
MKCVQAVTKCCVWLILALLVIPPDALPADNKADEFDPPLPGLYMVHKRGFTGRKTIGEMESSVQGSRTRSMDSLGSAYIALGRWEDAVNMFEQSLRKSDQNTAARHNLGIAYTYVKSYKFAVQSLESAADRDKYNPDIKINLGIALLYAGKLDESIEALEKSLKKKPRNARVAHFYLMLGYYYKEDYKNVEEHASKVRRFGEDEHKKLLQQVRRQAQRKLRTQK